MTPRPMITDPYALVLCKEGEHVNCEHATNRPSAQKIQPRCRGSGCGLKTDHTPPHYLASDEGNKT